MSVAQFQQCYSLLPEAMLLVAGDGVILAANPGACDRLGLPASALVGAPLAKVVSDPAEPIASYLRACSRSRQMILGALTLRREDGEEIPCRAEGAVFQPRSEGAPAQILLRLLPKAEALKQFIELSQRVEQLGQEIRRRRRVEEELRQQREWLQVVLTSIGDAVIATDDQGRVMFMNPVAEAQTGWPQAEALGRPLEEVFQIVHETTRQPVESPVRKVLREGMIAGLANHTVLLSRDGVEIPIDDCGAPIRDSQGRLLGVVLIFHDIAQRRELERELQRRAERLVEEVRRKDRFLTVLAHELRNPLAPITNGLHIIERPNASEEARVQARQIMGRQVTHLARLIDDLLDLSRINRGRVALRKAPIDARAVVAAAIESVKPILDQHRHEARISLPHEPAVIHADSMRIEQILVNLLTNAAKFTEPGGRIDVEVECDNRHVAIRVRDTGMGIPAEMLERIFEPFNHVDRTLDGSIQWGLGIGLSIVRSLTVMHGGAVEAQSAGRGRGSEFVVRLPRSAPADDQRRDSPIIESRPARRSLRVLAVDDNRDAADSLAMMLELQGHQARTAYDGRSAVAIARTFEPHVALLDLAMPGMDGYQTAELLRKQVAGRPVALVSLTGFGQEDHQRRSQEAGFLHHLVKPVDPHVLSELLDSLE